MDHMELRGRPPKQVEAEIVRQLTGSDLELLAQERPARAYQLDKLRTRHHTLAKMLSAGLSDVEIASATGYTTETIRLLKTSPAMVELIEHYRDEAMEPYRVVPERMATVCLTALELIQDRMEDAPDEIGISALSKIATDMADRTGFGPHTSSTTVNITVDMADRLRRGRERALEAHRASGLVIEHEVSDADRL